MEEKVVIKNDIGLHARLASKFISVANKYQANIFVEREGKTFNGKSLISIMSMGASYGDVITIKADGPDAGQALEALAKILG